MIDVHSEINLMGLKTMISNRYINRVLFLFSLMVLTPMTSYAAFSLSNTRIIYPEQNQGKTLVVKNSSTHRYGGQTWLEGDDPELSNSTFVATPSLFTVEGHSQQTIRVMKTGFSLPDDKETLFWFYLQELPPASKESNQLQFAMRTKIKLIYRPTSLQEGREGAEQHLQISATKTDLTLNNPTPYYFALSRLIYDKEKGQSTAEIIKDKKLCTEKRVSNDILFDL